MVLYGSVGLGLNRETHCCSLNRHVVKIPSEYLYTYKLGLLLSLGQRSSFLKGDNNSYTHI